MIAANERGLAQINTRFAGWIQKLMVSATGERVRRGQVLATIYSPDVLRAAAGIAGRARLERARRRRRQTDP